jgi:hypothetical protein
VGKKTIPQSLFNLTGMAKKAPSPKEAKGYYAQGQGQNHAGIQQKSGASGLVVGEIVHCQFDHPRNQELQKIHQ